MHIGSLIFCPLPVIAATHSPLAQEYAKKGCPVSNRGQIWCHILNVHVDDVVSTSFHVSSGSSWLSVSRYQRAGEIKVRPTLQERFTLGEGFSASLHLIYLHRDFSLLIYKNRIIVMQSLEWTSVCGSPRFCINDFVLPVMENTQCVGFHTLFCFHLSKYQIILI